MNIDSIRTLYEYHYGLYDHVWDCIMHLAGEQFVEANDYSVGSVRNQMIHVLEIDQSWIARLQEQLLPEDLSSDEYVTRSAVCGEWDRAVSYVMNYVNK